MSNLLVSKFLILVNPDGVKYYEYRYSPPLAGGAGGGGNNCLKSFKLHILYPVCIFPGQAAKNTRELAGQVVGIVVC